MKNEQAAAKGLPAWLDGGNAAVIGTVLTAAIGLGAMVMASSSGTRAHVDIRIDDVNKRIGGVNKRIDDVNANVNKRIDDVNKRIDDVHTRIHGLSVRMDGLDQRLIGVQEGVAEIRGHLGVPSAVRWQGRKAGTATPPDATPEPLP